MPYKGNCNCIEKGVHALLVLLGKAFPLSGNLNLKNNITYSHVCVRTCMSIFDFTIVMDELIKQIFAMPSCITLIKL